MTPPCKDCQERQLGCHSTCEKYLEYNAWAIENRKKRQYDHGFHIGFERKIRKWILNKK